MAKNIILDHHLHMKSGQLKNEKKVGQLLNTYFKSNSKKGSNSHLIRRTLTKKTNLRSVLKTRQASSMKILENDNDNDKDNETD